MEWYYKISLGFYRWVRQLDKRLVAFVIKKFDNLASNVTVTNSDWFDDLSERIDKKLEEDRTFDSFGGAGGSGRPETIIEAEVTGAKKIGLNRPYGIAIADVLRHDKYGVGSHQPVTSLREAPDIYRILFKDGVHRYINGDELAFISNSSREHEDYWLWFNKNYLDK